MIGLREHESYSALSFTAHVSSVNLPTSQFTIASNTTTIIKTLAIKNMSFNPNFSLNFNTKYTMKISEIINSIKLFTV